MGKKVTQTYNQLRGEKREGISPPIRNNTIFKWCTSAQKDFSIIQNDCVVSK